MWFYIIFRVIILFNSPIIILKNYIKKIFNFRALLFIGYFIITKTFFLLIIKLISINFKYIIPLIFAKSTFKGNRKKAYYKTFILFLNILVIPFLFGHFNSRNLGIIFSLLLLIFTHLKSFQTPYFNINALYTNF